MRYFQSNPAKTRVGAAFGPSAVAYLESHAGVLDYLEIPFEQIQHNPTLRSLQERIPLVLHCASASLAGEIASDDVLSAIATTAAQLKSPWIGEHLAFVTARALDSEDEAPTFNTVGYTICPQLSDESVERVIANVERMRGFMRGTRLLLENSPQYFAIPGSTMSMATYIKEVVSGADVDLLLDLSHFLITCRNTKVDPIQELYKLPLNRVVEIHISGTSSQEGISWDDHAAPAPKMVFDMFRAVLEHSKPEAVTFEYNWAPDFPSHIFHEHLDRARVFLDRQ
jgi:uncharacterized protein (UPF0276 family)